MNTLISYKLAVLLKEKGFDEPCLKVWESDNLLDNGYLSKNSDLIPTAYSAPTIADVIMWLYEKHGIWIYTAKDYVIPKFNYAIQQPNVYYILTHTHNNFNSSAEAYEVAIEYCLTSILSLVTNNK